MSSIGILLFCHFVDVKINKNSSEWRHTSAVLTVNEKLGETKQYYKRISTVSRSMEETFPTPYIIIITWNIDDRDWCRWWWRTKYRDKIALISIRACDHRTCTRKDILAEMHRLISSWPVGIGPRHFRGLPATITVAITIATTIRAMIPHCSTAAINVSRSRSPTFFLLPLEFLLPQHSSARSRPKVRRTIRVVLEL